MISFLLAASGTTLVVLGLIFGHATWRVYRANPAVYDANRVLTGDFSSAAHGTLMPARNPITDYQVKHYVEAILDESGKPVAWRRAGSLSDEAVDGVLARQF